MKIKRVIRFQYGSVEEKMKQENFENNEIPEKNKKDVNFNNVVLVEGYLQEDIEDSEENAHQIQYNASNELIRCVKTVISEGASTNIIGVFGSNSNVIVNNFCHDLGELSGNPVFIGQADGSSPLLDVYSRIGDLFFNYIMDTDWYRCTTRNDILITRLHVILDIDRVRNHDAKSEKLQYMLNIIKTIKELIDFSTLSRNNNSKLLVTIEMKELDYNILKDLLELKCSGLIIVISLLYDFDLVRTTFENSVGSNHECIDEFFGTDNYVIARENLI